MIDYIFVSKHFCTSYLDTHVLDLSYLSDHKLDLSTLCFKIKA